MTIIKPNFYLGENRLLNRRFQIHIKIQGPYRRQEETAVIEEGHQKEEVQEKHQRIDQYQQQMERFQK